MIGFLSKFWKKQPPPTATISLEELSKLWRDPVESKGEPKAASPRKEIPETDIESKAPKPQSVDLEVLINADRTSLSNNNDSWFDAKALLVSLQSRITKGRTSAFVYQRTAYYTLETVIGALNKQRESHHLKSLSPNEVIAFFKSEKNHGLESGKYLLRFDKGLPVKVYLYTHPITNKEVFEPSLPTDETGRRLKSLKPIKKPKQ